MPSWLQDLPDHLLERCEPPNGENAAPREGEQQGSLVLYWMRTAVRASENPALDVAKIVATNLDLPLLVYQGLSEQYEYASDRHHLFMLQGARDIQEQLRDEGTSYAFHLATPSDRRPHLVTLASQAAVVVTEDMPCDPPRVFLERLRTRVSTPIITVDTSCVAPMKLVGKAYTRAFQYRNATRRIYAERVTRAWPEVSAQPKSFDVSQLPFRPIDLATADLAELVSQCEIDHAVGPVPDTPGGTSAGYERWNRFRETRLSRYERKRNDALADGVSRMSAYLHYGMVSPFRIAREAADEGAEKYLDELLIWRELAYAFCRFTPDHDRWEALPAWARETLESRASDPRPQTYAWEALARGTTKDEFWNAAQQSLLMQGELHNNVRMTWGKALMQWRQSPQEALRLMIDLNHRYALDGRDPASYGGLLWCVGQFDRPFEPETPILGTVRPRSTEDHARRLSTEAYRHQVTTPRYCESPRVAVIGAGISGLAAARTLADHGVSVQIFDKSRGVGGRMATRRVDGQPRFDHGAQHFSAKDPRFRRYVDSWCEQGIVAPWSDSGTTVRIGETEILEALPLSNRFVGTPTMNAVCKHLGRGLPIQTETRIRSVICERNQIQLLDHDGQKFGPFDRVIVTAPAEQTSDILADFPILAEPIAAVKMRPCWALMVSLPRALEIPWFGAEVESSFLAWIARNQTKPGRSSEQEDLVIHAGPVWSEENWDEPPDEIADKMLAELWQVTGLQTQRPSHAVAHRWKYALANEHSPQGCYFDAERGIAACGDWCLSPNVEGGFLSGMAAAGRILTHLSLQGSRGPKSQQTLFAT